MKKSSSRSHAEEAPIVDESDHGSSSDHDDNGDEEKQAVSARAGDANDDDNQQGEPAHQQGQDEEPENDGNDNDVSEDEAVSKPKERKVHKLSLKKTKDFNETLRKRGVLYVARIPPRMTPTKLKTLLSDFGEVTRVFCQEEDAAKRKRRRKLTGNAAKRYTEGWVEFAKKKVAKRCAAALHQQPISNHKRNPHYGDLWSFKYLPKFQWSHLTEKVAYERRVREQKLRLETATARRETAQYKRLLETGKKLDKIAERKRKRGETLDDGDNNAGEKRKNKKGSFQLQPMDEGADKATRKPLLNSLV